MRGRRTILMVEDEQSITEPLSEALAREGFDTQVTGTAAGALELAGRVEPPLVPLDVMLPDGSGHDVCPGPRGRPGGADHLIPPRRGGEGPGAGARAGGGATTAQTL